MSSIYMFLELNDLMKECDLLRIEKKLQCFEAFKSL